MDIVYYNVNLDDDETGLIINTLVDEPASGYSFELFSNIQEFKLEEEKRYVTGPSMVPELYMLRKYKDTGVYYYGVFSKEAIENTVKKASKENVFNKLKLTHSKDGKNIISSAYLIESLILTDDNKSEKFKNLPNGTWLTTYWIEDKDYWNNVIKPGVESGSFTGFSPEIGLELVKSEDSDIQLFNKIKTILDSDKSDDYKEQLFSNIKTIIDSNIPDNEKDIIIGKLLS